MRNCSIAAKKLIEKFGDRTLQQIGIYIEMSQLIDPVADITRLYEIMQIIKSEPEIRGLVCRTMFDVSDEDLEIEPVAYTETETIH